VINLLSWQEYRTRVREISTRCVELPAAKLLEKLGLSPNQLTIIGLLLSVASAYLLTIGEFVVGGIILMMASALDMADGSLARLQGRASAVGALLDSTVDRVSEAVIFLGLLLFYININSLPEELLIFMALTSSFMVSYLRARGEGLGVDCKVGVMTRPERVVVLAAGLLINQVLIALGIISVLAFFTAIHRFWHIQNELSKRQ
jgi:CDP-diacylglycerol--glycerol-3-phosphate 3-phosphatidyltransferase